MNPDRWYLLGRPYDLSTFAHPGGQAALRLGRGRDATMLLLGQHLEAPPVLLRRLEPFLCTEPVCDPEGVYGSEAARSAVLEDAVLCATKRVVREYRSEVGSLAAPAVSLALSAVCLFAEVVFLRSWWRGSGLAGCGAGVAAWLCDVNVAHDASHGALRPRWLNAPLQYLALPFLFEPEAWRLQHVYSHHLHVNGDSDMDAHYLRPFARLDRRRDPVERRSKIWLCALTASLAFVSFAEVVLFPLQLARLLPARGPKLFFADAGEARRSLLAAAAVVALALTAAFRHGVLVALTPWLVSSVIFTAVTQSSHLTQPCLDAGAELRGGGAWGRLQVLTSVNYSCGSRLWSWLTGGLNLQSVHHAAPYVHSWHFLPLYPRLRRAWAQLGCAPLEAPSLAAAFGAHVEQLRCANSSSRRNVAAESFGVSDDELPDFQCLAEGRAAVGDKVLAVVYDDDGKIIALRSCMLLPVPLQVRSSPVVVGSRHRLSAMAVETQHAEPDPRGAWNYLRRHPRHVLQGLHFASAQSA